MLDDFINEQPIAYKILKNAVENNKYSHAYLFETNGYSKGLNLAVSFAKYLLCPNGFSNKEKCKNCNQCSVIDDNNYLELKIIESDGQWIKKNQLIELQESFSKKALIGNKKIYIINEAEKLNKSSANSLLKFLEEPEENIIAILVVQNSKQLLDTIISRCQLISLKKDNIKNNKLDSVSLIGKNLFNSEEEFVTFTQSENSKIKIDKIVEFVMFYEANKEDSILYMNKLWNDFFTERSDITQAFDILLLFYKDVLNYKMDRKIECFVDNKNELESISNKNDIIIISKKIKIILDLRQVIKYNVNTGLLMDKLIISLRGCEKND